MEKPSIFVKGAALGLVALVITRVLGLDWIPAILLSCLLYAIVNIAEKDQDIKSLQESRDQLAEELHSLKVEFGLEKPFVPMPDPEEKQEQK
jgi:hypothetical protein